MKFSKCLTYKLLPLMLIILSLSGCNFNFGSKLLSKLKLHTELQQDPDTQDSDPIEKSDLNLKSESTNTPPDNPQAIAQELYNNAMTFEEQANALKMFEDLAKSNDPYACFKAGEMHLEGIGTVKNPAIAMQWFQKAANQGSLKAMLQIGNMYRWAIGENYSLNTAIDWYKKAAHLGYVDAMLVLGEIYRGYGIQADYNQSMDWYIKAASMGSTEAEQQIIRLITNDLVDHKKYSNKIAVTLELLHKAAKENNLDAMVALGDYYAQQTKHELALDSYNKAAVQGSAAALLRLGLLYLNGSMVNKDYLLAIDYFTKSADLGNIASQYHLGEIYRKGLGVDKNVKLASFWYHKAIENNFPKAPARLADLYFVGKGVEPDLHKAIDLYIKAATLGDSYSGLILSIFYAKGMGVEQSLPNSVHWYNTVEAKQDQLLAKFEVGKSYEIGFGFKKNYEEAAKWYLLSAQGGFAKAQAQLAELYLNGLGVRQSYKQAISWYYQAASQGYNYAQYSLSLLLQSNSKAKFYKPKAAYQLMKKAAIAGYKPAQYSLALMLLQGNGVNANAIKAYSWLNIALSEQGGYESNPELMDVIINKLEPSARHKAVALVQRYRNRYNFKSLE